MPKLGTHGTAGVRNGPEDLRVALAQINHRAADQREREQGADAHHFAQNVDRGERRHDGDDDSDQELTLVGRAERWMHLREHFWQKAVLGDGEEDAALPVEQDQDDGR